MKLIDRVRAVRDAGAVERCHTLPHLGSYSVASHSWGVCMLLRILYPGERHLIDYALSHDVPERWTGDIPSQVIGDNLALRSELRERDREIMSALDLPCEHDLTGEELKKLKACDRLDFWLWCLDQFRLGNTNLSRAWSGVGEQLLDPEQTPREVIFLVEEISQHGLARLPERFSEVPQ